MTLSHSRYACTNTPSPRGLDDGYECGGDRGRSLCLKRPRAYGSSSSPDDEIAIIVSQLSNRRQNPSPRPWFCEPRPSWSRSPASSTWQQKFLRTIGDLYCFWKRLCKDPFRWEILKSALWFTLGLRLFGEVRSRNDILNKDQKCIKNISMQPDLFKNPVLTYAVIPCDFDEAQ